MNITMEDSIIVGPDSDSSVGSIFDFKAIDYVIVAINIKPHISVRSILAIDHSGARRLRSQYDRAGSAAAGSQMNAPAAGVVGVGPRHDHNGSAGRGKAVSMGD